MKQLAMLLVAGVVAFTLSACGEERQPKQPQVDENGAAATQPAGNEVRPVNNVEPKHENNVAPKPENDAANGQEAQY